MKIPEEIEKCVAFIESEGPLGVFKPVGTVFFITMSSQREEDSHRLYAVTARHIIDSIESKRWHTAVFLRLNSIQGGLERIRTYPEKWLTHPDHDPKYNYIDVAILPLDSNSELDWLFWPVEGFATTKAIKEAEISVGDDVFLTGLFYRHYGTTKNVPIIRSGIISALPNEPVYSDRFYVNGYLIEARSIAGLSGSPVFVRPESLCTRSPETGDELAIGRWGGMASHYWLLGLMHGHWNIKSEEIDTVTTDSDGIDGINAGIGIVVPAQKIIETIEYSLLGKKV